MKKPDFEKFKCQYCGKERLRALKGDRGRKIFCSQSCSAKSRKKVVQ